MQSRYLSVPARRSVCKHAARTEAGPTDARVEHGGGRLNLGLIVAVALSIEFWVACRRSSSVTCNSADASSARRCFLHHRVGIIGVRRQGEARGESGTGGK
jgi:hypothetical protein